MQELPANSGLANIILYLTNNLYASVNQSYNPSASGYEYDKTCQQNTLQFTRSCK